jgi:hypothetical protein
VNFPLSTQLQLHLPVVPCSDLASIVTTFVAGKSRHPLTMATAAQAGIALAELINKIGQALDKLEKFKLKPEHQKLFEVCYGGFYDYLKDVGRYCIEYEAMFIYLGGINDRSVERIMRFLETDKRLVNLTTRISALADAGLTVCAVRNVYI